MSSDESVASVERKTRSLKPPGAARSPSLRTRQVTVTAEPKVPSVGEAMSNATRSGAGVALTANGALDAALFDSEPSTSPPSASVTAMRNFVEAVYEIGICTLAVRWYDASGASAPAAIGCVRSRTSSPEKTASLER